MEGGGRAWLGCGFGKRSETRVRPFPGPRQREGSARGISPSSLWSYLFWEFKTPSSPGLHVQRGKINYSIPHLSQGSNEGLKHGKSHAQDPEHHPSPGECEEEICPPSPKPAAPLMLHTTQACPNPESFPAASPLGRQPLGPALPSQNNLRHLGPHVIQRSPDVWGSGPR